MDLNLPGNSNYNPRKPRVYKVRDDGKIAADLFIYIDYLRPTASTEGEAWEAAHQVDSKLCWFGLQDVAWKQRPGSMTTGAWAGTIIHTTDNEVTVLVSEEKWFKTKKWITWMGEVIAQGLKFDHKELEPYMQGIHQTIEMWQGDRDESGWKRLRTKLEIHANLLTHSPPPMLSCGKRPPPGCKVQVEGRLENDITALQRLTSFEAPPKVVQRRETVAQVYYGFGDASGKGFGHGIQMGEEIYLEFGQWFNVFKSYAHSKDTGHNSEVSTSRHPYLLKAEVMLS